MDPLAIFVLSFLFILGAVVGSFLNVCIHRFPPHDRVLPAWQSLVSPPSHCPRCKTEIRWYDNVPIFGWLWLRGRCRACRLPIPIRYPAIELLTALLFLGLYWVEVPLHPVEASSVWHPLGPLGPFHWGPIHWPGFYGTVVPAPGYWSAATIMNVRCAFHLILVTALIVATFIDFDLMIIPDAVTRPATIAGIIGNTAFGFVHLVPVWYAAPGGLTFSNLWLLIDRSNRRPEWVPSGVWSALIATEPPAWTTAHPHLHGLAVSLSGIVVGASIVWLVRTVGFWALKREAMGDGDIYLMAMIGSFLGWQATVVVFFLAPLCALAVAFVMLPFQRAREIPYGPYLSLAALLVLFAFRYVWPPFESGLFSLGPAIPLIPLVMAPALGGMLRVSRIVLRRFGIDDALPTEGVWEAADQLAYQAMERVDEQQVTWRTSQWPGIPASRGQDDLEWRRRAGGDEWKRWWMRTARDRWRR